MNKRPKSLRENIFQEAMKLYGVSPEYPWAKYPSSAILRHQDNNKWFALVMDIKKEKLGLTGDDIVDILNIKAEPEVVNLLIGTPGYFPAYHMNKEQWITILLDGSVDIGSILPLLDMSFSLTSSKGKEKSAKKRITNWLVPANPSFYDVRKVIAENPGKPFLWKQSSHIETGNTVYMYITAPVRAVLYKCRVIEADIPYQYADKNLSMQRAMKLQLLEQYDEKLLTMDRLKEHGVYAVRGPRSMPESLIRELSI